MAATTRRKAAAPVEPEVDEFEELEDEVAEDEDLEELEDDEPEEAPAPKAKRTAKKVDPAKKAAEAPKNGSAWLAAHVTEQTGETFDARGIRMLLRKLAKDGALDRAVGETRDRYSFSGPDDAIVVQVVKMVQDGTAKAMKQEGLAKLKEAGEAKKAAKKAAAAKESEEAVDEDELEEEEAPRPRTRRAAPAKAAPAKATKSTTTRRRASASAE